jgi:voltage-gated potassium channel
MTRMRIVERKMTKFLREPPTVRGAASAIVVATAAVVVLSGVLMRIFDHREYSSIWEGMWWAMQTVTTVGYGDVTPEHWSGRLIAYFVMLVGVAFLAVVTAAITSTFVARATKEREEEREATASQDEVTEFQKIEARFDELDRKIDRLEAALREQRGS